MNPKLFLVPVLGSMLAASGLAALDVSLSAEIRLGKAVAPPPPEVVVIQDAGPKGPPPWAPAHGFRRNRQYYYYPEAHVYYRPADRMWFYLDGRDWRFGVSLPAFVRVDFDHSVALTMETDQPYAFHEHVRTYYPADYFVTRVRVKEKGDRPGHDDSPGKAKGKGRKK